VEEAQAGVQQQDQMAVIQFFPLLLLMEEVVVEQVEMD
jgi:hypothetical protein